ncbi:hypothetical protein A2U01_0054423, partial [Trifolium medium]|nr:hypothetical protein [Trifolium medium]
MVTSSWWNDGVDVVSAAIDSLLTDGHYGGAIGSVIKGAMAKWCGVFSDSRHKQLVTGCTPW